VVLDAEPGSTVGDLRRRAERELCTGLCKLISESGRLLPELATIDEVGLKSGEHLTAAVRQPQIAATLTAFALLRADGSVVTWGEPNQGGDSSEVQEDLHDILDIQASDYAFAARRADGCVAAERAFAAILSDGSVVAWGDSYNGGDCTAVSHELQQVKHIQASRLAFAALRADGSVVTWGHPDYAGDCGPVREQLKGVREIQASWGAFAALLESGRVVTWGDRDLGGDSRSVSSQLHDVRK
ncbi:unnamed protein product, partial [Symbiodinium pilosum]